MSIVDPDLLAESVLRTRSVEEEGWSTLPGDIFEHVLRLLSFPEVYRLSCVCKRWDDVIRTQFQERELPWGPFYSPRVMWEGKGSRAVPWFAYDPSETTMRKTSMPQLEFPKCARKAHWDLIAAGGGLLCFGAWGGPRRILVCNPMTKAWRELPDVTLDYRTCWVTVVDECRSSYKLLFAGDAAVDAYDFVTNKWSAAEPLSNEMSFESGVYRNAEMFLLGKTVSSGRYMVMILELATLTWREDIIRMPVCSVKYRHIVAWSGEVYLVGGSSEMPMESILLFRLDPGGRWTRVSEYAKHAFVNETGAIYGCGAHAERIFVVTRDWVAVYNCAAGLWEEPVMGYFLDMNDIYKTKFVFQPNLVAAP